MSIPNTPPPPPARDTERCPPDNLLESLVDHVWGFAMSIPGIEQRDLVASQKVGITLLTCALTAFHRCGLNKHHVGALLCAALGQYSCPCSACLRPAGTVRAPGGQA